MTQKIYRTAMGKPVDMGALQLQNENVRAVGNMGVNARGDVIDSGNKVIDRKNRQVQRQYKRSTNVSDRDVATSNVAVKKAAQQKQQQQQEQEQQQTQNISPTEIVDIAPTAGGLAAAIARAREVQQTLETPLTNKPAKTGVKKI